ncbi:MAG: TetR/AcrR family transcriptional regulator [Actinomycetota bacterium]|nr:TetR/AcrR family transcriptional regulator [Actinomycetota bacterium]
MSVDLNETVAKKRRVPQQSRSRDRVMRILDAAAALVCEEGVDAITTRGIAEQAEIPVASLYQYFADKDEILLALVERDVEELDAQVAGDIAELRVLSVRTIVSATMDAYTRFYRERPAFVMIWLRGRTNQAIKDYGRVHNTKVAEDLLGFVTAAGLLDATKATRLVAEIAVEMTDRCFQLAFESSMTGEPQILSEARELVTTYLERYATKAGIDGVPIGSSRAGRAGGTTV